MRLSPMSHAEIEEYDGLPDGSGAADSLPLSAATVCETENQLAVLTQASEGQKPKQFFVLVRAPRGLAAAVNPLQFDLALGVANIVREAQQGSEFGRNFQSTPRRPLYVVVVDPRGFEPLTF